MSPCVRSLRKIRDIWPLLYWGNRARSALFCTTLIVNSPRAKVRDGGPNQILINGFQIGLPAEHDVGGVFGFVQAPVIRFLDLLENRAIPFGEFIELAMQKRRFPTVRQGLSGRPILNGAEGIVQQGVAYFLPVQLPRQPVVAIAIKLQPERAPGGHPHIAEPQFFIDEVEIVMQTLAVVVAQKSTSALFV